MKKISIVFWTTLLLITFLWFLADTLFPQPFTYFSFRQAFMQYSGLIAIAGMSLSLVLAVRPRFIEQKMDGLDKMYRLHKWLGIIVLIFAILHWWLGAGTKWMVQWGWIESTGRRMRGSQELVGPLQQWLNGQRGIAEEIGSWAFYATLLLLVIALIKKMPYRFFIKTHKILAVAYLLLVAHTIVLFKPAYWIQPVGWITILLLLAGTVSAIIMLSGAIGFGRKAKGHIQSLEYYPELRVTEIVIKLEAGWAGHQAGQFVFVKTNHPEKAHPFTIASAWDPEQRLVTFITKALGDYTNTLHTLLKINDAVTIEGPYGQFVFDHKRHDQIWIGGGIGITPFIAKMKQLAQEKDRSSVGNIQLFHTTKDYNSLAIKKLTDDALAAGVHLHLFVDDKDGQLTGDRIRALVPNWQNSSIWFCGPTGFYKDLKNNFAAKGFSSSRFHYEMFDFR